MLNSPLRIAFPQFNLYLLVRHRVLALTLQSTSATRRISTHKQRALAALRASVAILHLVIGAARRLRMHVRHLLLRNLLIRVFTMGLLILIVAVGISLPGHGEAVTHSCILLRY